MKTEDILNIPLGDNDADADTRPYVSSAPSAETDKAGEVR
jgi:hypothetical protein